MEHNDDFGLAHHGVNLTLTLFRRIHKQFFVPPTDLTAKHPMARFQNSTFCQVMSLNL